MDQLAVTAQAGEEGTWCQTTASRVPGVALLKDRLGDASLVVHVVIV